MFIQGVNAQIGGNGSSLQLLSLGDRGASSQQASVPVDLPPESLQAFSIAHPLLQFVFALNNLASTNILSRSLELNDAPNTRTSTKQHHRPKVTKVNSDHHGAYPQGSGGYAPSQRLAAGTCPLSAADFDWNPPPGFEFKQGRRSRW
jgi:hypothetical protein